MTDELDRAGISRLVHAFYARIQEDELLGPVFETRVREAYEEILARLEKATHKG